MTVFPSTSALHLAQDTAEQYVLHGEVLSVPSTLPSALYIQRACYVGLHEQPGNRLRAVYGTPLPRQQSLAHEIVFNTVTALRVHESSNPVRKAELRSLTYAITVLGPLERITSEKHLNPSLYGLYISTDTGKSAIILPGRIGIDTPQEQLSTAWREARIEHGEALSMYRFSISRFE